MNLNDAITKHAEWKFKLRNAVRTKEHMDVATIAKDNQCELGKWLYSEGRSLYGNNPAHAKCLAKHAAFHQEAAKVASVANTGDTDKVERLIANDSPFSATSKEVGIALVELKNVAVHK